MIKFNEVTWYSKLAAIIFFLGIVPILTFYIGARYQETKELESTGKYNPAVYIPKHVSVVSEPTTLKKNISVTSVSFNLIEKSFNSGYKLKENFVVNNLEQWKDVWSKAHSGHLDMPKLPDVDFSKNTVFAVFMGQKTSGGNSIEITKVSEYTDKIVVTVQTISPGRGCVTTTSLTEPSYIASVSKITKPVTFVSDDKVTMCN